MVYTTYSDSGQGIGSLFLYAKSVVPFYDSILFGVILLIITFSLYFIQEQKRGKGDFTVSFAVGCTVTTILAVILSMLAGFTSAMTLGILIALTILSYIMLFFSDP